MKKRIAILLITFPLALIPVLSQAQIGINNSAANPDASAILDLNTGNSGVNKGFLPPQVALTNVAVAAPVTSPATGLIVYSSTAPTGGSGLGYYYWNGSSWLSLGGSPVVANLTQGTGVTAFSYNGSSAATVGIANTGVTANSYGNASNYPTFTVNAQGQLTAAGTQALPTSLPPNGTAGGNLSGTYPNPTVSKINGASVPVAGSLITGNVLQVNGASSTTYGPVNIAGGANYITGNLPVANLDNGTNANSTTFWRGDGTWANPTAATLLNLTQGTGITSFTYNGSSTATVGIANTGVTAGNYGSATTVPTYTVNAQGQITSAANVPISASGIGAVTAVTASAPLASSGGNTPNISLTGTVAVANGGTGLGTTPANGKILIGNGTNYTLSTITAGSGISVTNGAGSITITNTGGGGGVTSVAAGASGANSGGGLTFSSNPITTTGSIAIANTGVGTGTYGDASYYPIVTVNAQGQLTNVTTQAVPTSLPPSGAAFGDLSGVYPGPAVVSINNASVPVAGSLTTGNVLQVSGTNSLTYAPVNIGGGANNITGSLPVSNLDNGSNANSTTFWRGDGTWATPAGGSISGSGTNGYLALWTPNSTTLGTSVLQDDGTEIGIGIAPEAGQILAFNTSTLSGIDAETSLSGATALYGYSASGAGAYCRDGLGDYAVLASVSTKDGVQGYGLNYGGVFGDNSGDVGDIADGIDGYAINAYGSSAGGYFVAGSNQVYVADNANGNGIAALGASVGGTFESNSGAYGYIADGAIGAEFENTSGIYMYVCNGGSGYVTNGSKSTEVKDKNNQERLLFCNESPEVKFEDYGEGQLVNGRVHIALDSLFAINVTINEKHPMHVFIELEGDCNGTYVTNKTANGFDVVELNHGASNTPFSWHIVCNRANEAGEDRNYAEKRFPVGPDAPKKPQVTFHKQAGTGKPVQPNKQGTN